MKVNDFFCGAGGMGLGFRLAGFEIAGAWDFDKYAVETYRHNIGAHVQLADIAQLRGADIPDADVWTFGFPCQDLSIAGRRAGMERGTRSGLFFEIMRLLSEVERRPKIILAENVKMLKPYLPTLAEEYAIAGYRMKVVLYNSKYFGVPQNRERYFVIGIRDDIAADFNFRSQQTDFVPRLSSVLEPHVDERYYIADHLVQRVLEEAEKRLARKQSDQPRLPDIDVVGLSDHNGHDLIRRVYSTEGIAPSCNTGSGGGQTAKIVEAAQALFVTEKDECAYACVSSYYKGISPSDIGNAKRTHIVEGSPEFRVRKLTTREYARLQGFPDTFEQIVSNSQFYKQMGNAVTVNVARDIANQVSRFLFLSTLPTEPTYFIPSKEIKKDNGQYAV